MFRVLSAALCTVLLAACAVSPDVWRPYPSVQDNKLAEEGWEEGDRMPNLLFKNSHGESRTLNDFRGKALFVHFWGSWCRPCKKEMRHVQELYNQVDHPDVEFVLLNMWEPFSEGQEWMKENDYQLPIYDSSSGGFEDRAPLVLASGERINPLKKVPRTFVIDKNGIILYRRNKSKSNWPSYVGALNDVAKNSVVHK